MVSEKGGEAAVISDNTQVSGTLPKVLSVIRESRVRYGVIDMYSDQCLTSSWIIAYGSRELDMRSVDST